MKTISLLLTVLILGTTRMGAQVDQGLINLVLRDGTNYVTYSHRITQVFGEWEYRNSVGYGPVTNIAYQTFEQIMYLVRDSAKRENWDQDRWLKSANYFKNNAKGGRVILYVERFDFYFSNLKFFFLILRDSTDVNQYEYNFPYRAADLVTSERFSNWGICNLPADPGDKFYIYVNHRETAHLSDHKFLVEKYAAIPPVSASLPAEQ